MSSLASPARPVKSGRPRQPRPRPAWPIRITVRPTSTIPGILRIAVGDEPWTDYHFTRLPSDLGAAFRLVKLLPPCKRYDVLLAGERSSCECKGFLRHGHCKHVEGLQKLVNIGRL